MLAGENETYFFQQSSRHGKTGRRFKKNPDDLPQELRYAHLNPRVAAYLATKEKEQKLSNELDLCDGFGEKSLLPQIHQSVSLIRQRLDHLLPHTEDAQRLIFDDTCQSSIRILDRLENLLRLFEGTTINVPPALETELLCGYKELIANVQYVARDWQCPANKEAYLQQVMSNDRSVSSGWKDDTASIAGSVCTSTDEDKGGDGLRKWKNKPIKSVVLGNIAEVDEGKARPKKKNVQLSVSSERRRVKCDRGRSLVSTSWKSTSGTESISVYSAETCRPSQRHLSVTRLQHDDPVQGIFNKRDKDSGYWMTINFQLSSKLCDDKGWILPQISSTNLEYESLLQWATEQLRAVLKQRRLNDNQNKASGSDGPLVLQYYGVTTRDELTRRKSASAAQERYIQRKMISYPQRGPAIPLMCQPDTGRDLLMVGLPDGSATIFYLSGFPAIVLSRRVTGAGGTTSAAGCYAFVYSDCPQRHLLACFTPSGGAATYYQNGSVHFLATSGGGTVALPSGEVVRRWSWPPNHGRLASSITITLNHSVSLRCSSLSQMFLIFIHQRETHKVNVGMSCTYTAPPTPEKDVPGSLVSGLPFLSRAAKQLAKTGKSEKSRQKAAGTKNTKKSKPPEVEKMLHFDLQHSDNHVESDHILHRLQCKARELVEGWLEHYRFTLCLRGAFQGILHKMSHRVARVRLVHSASVGNMRHAHAYTQRLLSAPSASTKSFSGDGHGRKVHFSSRPTTTTSTEPTSTLSNRSDTSSARNDVTSCNWTPRTEPVSRSAASLPTRPSTRPATCPLALRQQLLMPTVLANCHCHVTAVPCVSDVEFDVYVQQCVPADQVLVVAVISDTNTEESATVAMLSILHVEMNAGRSQPCAQNSADPWRIVHYYLSAAADKTTRSRPLLQRRHNVAADMVLIYQAGQLLFCDHIFNGYGNDRQDFEKQVLLLQQDLANGQPPLPMDFHFSPLKGRHGTRAGTVQITEARRRLIDVSSSFSLSNEAFDNMSTGKRYECLRGGTFEENVDSVKTFSLQNKTWISPSVKASLALPGVKSTSDILLAQPTSA